MKYAWIAANKAVWPITLSCDTLGVSASGYFEHQRRSHSKRPTQLGNARLSNEALLAHIRVIHAHEAHLARALPLRWGCRSLRPRVQLLAPQGSTIVRLAVGPSMLPVTMFMVSKEFANGLD